MAEMRSLMERSHAAQYHAHCPWTSLAGADGLVIRSGQGAVLTDMEGNRYIDAISGGWNVALGYSARPLIDAAVQQLAELPYYNTLYNRTTEASVQLSELLRSISPFPAGRLVYANSGSEAVEAAVKLAWFYHCANDEPGRRKILSRQNSVHGSTIFTSCLGGLGLNDLLGPEPLVRHISTPNPRLSGREDEDSAAFLARMLAELESVIEEESARTIAAMIIEPIPVVEGFCLPPGGYLPAVKSILNKHGILLIFDEVVTGFGRTGKMFAAELLDCVPDLMVLGKGLTSGYAALGAVLPSERVGKAVDRFCETIGEFPHAMTTAMHPVAMRVATACIDMLTTGGVLSHAGRMSPIFQARLRLLLEQHEGVVAVNGVGMGGSLHLESAPDESTDLSAEIARICGTRGVLVHGQHGSIIIAPPLIVNEDEIDTIFNSIDGALTEVLSF